MKNPVSPEPWPTLPPLSEWEESFATLHLWTQIVGKIRLAQSPWTNHSWHAPLYVTARGLTTSPIPHGRRIFQIDFDFVGHSLQVLTAEGATRSIALAPRSVADFHHELFAILDSLGLPVEIHGTPNEIEDAIPFGEDQTHASYDAEQVNRFWRGLLQADRVLKSFRAGFLGKASPVHFFWGSFDLAVTRFSGRDAPPHPGGFPNLPDWVAREAYSHEVSSAGFWPGLGLGEAAFYSYAYPAPPGFSGSPVAPADARWDSALGEFILPYRSVQQSADPDAAVAAFLESTYRAAAQGAEWDVERLERAPLSVPPAP
ncbi:MAG TPA: DUF5996 family protein [Longimicrobium sp.]|nr:DUF5996 family protein [Longimicrobium sp.]